MQIHHGEWLHPLGAHVKELDLKGCGIAHGVARPVGAHVAEGRRSTLVAAAPSRRCPTCRRSRTSRCQACRPRTLEGGGFKAWDFHITDGWPLAHLIDLRGYGATISGCREASLDLGAARPHGAARPVGEDAAVARPCSSLMALPDLSALTDLKVDGLPNHLRPWKAGGFKA